MAPAVANTPAPAPKPWREWARFPFYPSQRTKHEHIFHSFSLVPSYCVRKITGPIPMRVVQLTNFILLLLSSCGQCCDAGRLLILAPAPATVIPFLTEGCHTVSYRFSSSSLSNFNKFIDKQNINKMSCSIKFCHRRCHLNHPAPQHCLLLYL